jgi:ribosomal protein S18 acetylase RimI-like enzyme
MFRINQKTDEKNITAAIGLFREYAAWLGVDLGFQGFEKELSLIGKMYAPPHGALFVVYENDEAVGCLGLRKIDNGVGELKRMYLKEAYRNQGLGKMLLDEALERARSLGYLKVRLDTLDSMIPAMRFYEKNGFVKIPPYYHNPIEGAVYFEMNI